MHRASLVDSQLFNLRTFQAATNQDCKMSEIPIEPHVGEHVPVGLHSDQPVAVEPHVEPQVPPEAHTEQYVPAQPQGGLIQVDDVKCSRKIYSLELIADKKLTLFVDFIAVGL
jgi:hypothetical protein